MFGAVRATCTVSLNEIGPVDAAECCPIIEVLTSINICRTLIFSAVVYERYTVKTSQLLHLLQQVRGLIAI